jgi:proteic killer suppression protein
VVKCIKIKFEVNIVFANTKLEKIFNSQKLLQKEYGAQVKKIRIRMAVLEKAPCLAVVPVKKPDRRHELTGNRKGTFAVDLKHPFRLVFEPAEKPVPKKEDSGIDLEKVLSIRILAVEDYH